MLNLKDFFFSKIIINYNFDLIEATEDKKRQKCHRVAK
jgi:hypothetical protein